MFRITITFLLLASIITSGCSSQSMDPTRQLTPNPLERGELEGAKRVMIVPVPGEFCVWCKRGRIKKEGAIGAGLIGGGIGVGAVVAAGTTTTATGATVVAMTPAAAAATAGIAVAAVGIWVAVDAEIRKSFDLDLEQQLASDLCFRPEKDFCEGMKSELEARHGIEVIELNDASGTNICDVIVLVRTWNYGLFRIYTIKKQDKPLRPFHLITAHVIKKQNIDSELLNILKELNSASNNSEPTHAVSEFLHDDGIWFGTHIAEQTATWFRFLIADLPLDAKAESLLENSDLSKQKISEKAYTLGQRYGFHLALLMR